MSDNPNFEQEFEKMLAEDQGQPAVAEGEAPAAPATPAKTRKAKVKTPEGPNPYGIYVKRTGEVVTMSYLRKWAQCSARGDQFLYNRDQNIDFFMSDEFLKPFTGKPVGDYCDAVRTSKLWIDPEHPEAGPKIEPKQPKPAKEPKKKGKKTSASQAEVAAAAEDEQKLLDGEQPVASDAPVY